jgi:hypothetical protein
MQSEFTDTQIVKIAQIWKMDSSEIKEMMAALGPMLRKTEAPVIFEFMVEFSAEHNIQLAHLSKFVSGLFKTLRAKDQTVCRTSRKI